MDTKSFGGSNRPDKAPGPAVNEAFSDLVLRKEGNMPEQKKRTPSWATIVLSACSEPLYLEEREAPRNAPFKLWLCR